MSVPSYLFSGVNASVAALNEALDQIGGGDARITTYELHTLIHPLDESSGVQDRQVLWTGSNAIGVRNIDMPLHAPMSDSMKYYEVTSSSTYVKRNALFIDALPHEYVPHFGTSQSSNSFFTAQADI